MNSAFDADYGVVIHREFKPLWADQRFAEIYGFNSVADVLQQSSLLHLIDRQAQPFVLAQYRDIIEGKTKPSVKRYNNHRLNGEPLHILAVEHIVEFEGDKALQITIIDVTKGEQAKHKLEESRRKYRDLVLNSHQGIVIHRNFEPLLVNDAYAKLIAAESGRDIVQWSSMMRIIPDYFHDEAKRKYHSVVSGQVAGLTSTVETRCLDGTSKMFELHESAIDWDGEPALLVFYQDVTEKHQLQQQLAFQANHDSLTGCLNRKALSSFIRRHASSSLCLLMLDIDGFKSINDRFGHGIGDQVIAAVAEVCQQQLGEQGQIGRWGGEEFLVALPNSDIQRGQLLAEQIRRAVAAQQFDTCCGPQSITISLGVAANSPGQPFSFEQQLQRADDQLYLAKRNGKNQVRAA